MSMTLINLAALKAVNLAASTEETRYYLNGVLVECRADTVTYVATEGHVLLVVQEHLPDMDEGEDRLIGDYIIPSDVCKAAKLQRRAPNEARLIALEDGRLELGGRVFAPIDGTFPDWRHVCPVAQEPIKAGAPIAQFDPAYIGTLGKFAEMMGYPKPHIHHTEYCSPHAATFGDDARAFAVLMPLRNHAPAWEGRPAWTDTKAAKQPVAQAAE